MTIATVKKKDPKEIIDQMHTTRQNFLEGLSTFGVYGRVWTRRNEHVKDTALDML